MPWNAPGFTPGGPGCGRAAGKLSPTPRWRPGAAPRPDRADPPGRRTGAIAPPRGPPVRALHVRRDPVRRGPMRTHPDLEVSGLSGLAVLGAFGSFTVI